ncbi:MAG: TIGR03084 family metal-binding protein [Pseudomonadota bacterium]
MSLEQAQDFLEETETLAALLADLEEPRWALKTQFKGWTINDVIAHLRFWTRGADMALTDPGAFAELAAAVSKGLAGGNLRQVENGILADLTGRALFDVWLGEAMSVAARWRDVDPKTRVPWVNGLEMSARSSMTARQMETWAHGHEIFDRLGAVREETDRIRNIVVLGVNTYGFAFKLRGMEPPGPMPQVVLTAPSGAEWVHGEAGNGRVVGSAVAFAEVVTQTRAFADVDLRAEGAAAEAWMAVAQCFAGKPEAPPESGSRGLHAG